MAAGLCLSAGLIATPAGAAVTNSANTPPASMVKAPLSAAPAATVPADCGYGSHNDYEYWSMCPGAGPASYRAIATCANGMVALGHAHQDGSGVDSKASCQVDGMDSTLTSTSAWGLLLCSNDTGTGVAQGYKQVHLDISAVFANWGNGNIVAGETYMCQRSALLATSLPESPLSGS